MRGVIFVPNRHVLVRAGAPGGLSLLERQVRQLAALGLDTPLLLVPRVDGEPPMEVASGEIVYVPADTRDVIDALVSATSRLPAEFIFTSADRLIDLRVLRALRDARGPVIATADAERPEPVGRAAAADVRRGGAALRTALQRLDVAQLDPYVPELRGTVSPFIIPVRSAAERAAAWPILLDAVQKRALDLPGNYFDTPFENAILRRIASTRITPNQITALTVLLAGVTGVLFRYGWLCTGLVLALTVGILDGVDGKLARLKLATSRLGALEHVTDFFYENFWYLSLATHLSAAAGAVHLWHAGLILVGCDLADNLLYLAVRLRTGRTLDEMSTFDRRFRSIAGRRNVYVMIFAGGFLSGHPASALVAATIWSILTVLVHGMRCVAVWIERPILGPVRELEYQMSEIEPPTGILAQEK